MGCKDLWPTLAPGGGLSKKGLNAKMKDGHKSKGGMWEGTGNRVLGVD